jgi:hypothetical protein
LEKTDGDGRRSRRRHAWTCAWTAEEEGELGGVPGSSSSRTSAQRLRSRGALIPGDGGLRWRARRRQHESHVPAMAASFGEKQDWRGPMCCGREGGGAKRGQQGEARVAKMWAHAYKASRLALPTVKSARRPTWLRSDGSRTKLQEEYVCRRVKLGRLFVGFRGRRREEEKYIWYFF